GAVLLGKLNMDEFAMGGSSEHTIFGPVRNPWNTEHVAGGSSGGSAASVAAHMAAYSLGSDTGGSVRQPASFCGIVGMKPTYGRVSRYGLIAFASSLDQIGPLTKDVTDCAIVMNAISGYDRKDSTSVDVPCDDYLKDIDSGVENLRIGLPSEFFSSDMDGDVREKVMSAIKKLEARGAVIREVSLPSLRHSVAAYYLISSSEASSNLARYDGIRYGYRSGKAGNISQLFKISRGEGFGREVKRRILTGTYALSSGYHDELYIKALKVRKLIAGDFGRVFEDIDIVAAPVYPVTAFRIGERIEDPLKMYLGDIFTVSANLAGIPALSVPCGLDRNGLPVGIQFMGKPFSEKLLLRAGYAVEQETGRLEKPE
ncbi:MAG TPA: Asp-tRNA(Asn)/Glu-tRNA(Gln) amidotransferase subunit GatA, partial [Clostridiaceae bacterium]|nr:Asp-tRNA(Asn)/Glu-tRNA(Gln) amidotransferase subunit GatA [Clostridiaceae bacterium]